MSAAHDIPVHGRELSTHEASRGFRVRRYRGREIHHLRRGRNDVAFILCPCIVGAIIRPRQRMLIVRCGDDGIGESLSSPRAVAAMRADAVAEGLRRSYVRTPARSGPPDICRVEHGYGWYGTLEQITRTGYTTSVSRYIRVLG